MLIKDYRKTYHRKIKEICLATTLSEIVPKKDIPLIYLHVAYYGVRLNRLTDILDTLDLKEGLSVLEAAEIVTRIKYPESFSSSRTRQIKIRVSHLIELYNKHKQRNIFKIYD